ncbi:MAG: hypothetical protein BWY26_00513 [Elusimicrobia bacterium ADurb.Bin231]|mgnify:CR=1 FL=1|nr:MAG: hypothetical protein BWY26_00513 [Elusimicrobia bacterium ADurb.Bin231]
MIENWKIVPYTSTIQPGRYRVYIKCDQNDLASLREFFRDRMGQPWRVKDPDYTYSFYFYDLSDADVEEMNSKLTEFRNSPELLAGINTEKKEDISSQKIMGKQEEETRTVAANPDMGGTAAFAAPLQSAVVHEKIDTNKVDSKIEKKEERVEYGRKVPFVPDVFVAPKILNETSPAAGNMDNISPDKTIPEPAGGDKKQVEKKTEKPFVPVFDIFDPCNIKDIKKDD